MSANNYWGKMTPEERSAEMRKRMRTRRRTKRALNHNKKERHGGKVEAVHAAYIFGKVETIIEHYADSAGVPRAALADGVADLFCRKAGR